MSDKRVAERYATSVVELAQEQGLLESLKDDMQEFRQLCEASREFLTMLKSPIIQNIKKNSILRAVFSQANDLSLRFFEVVSKKNRANVLYDIAVEIIHQYNSLKGIQAATVTTAVEVGPELKFRFEEAVKQISQKPQVELDYKVDKTLIGGYVLSVGDNRIDNSIQNGLKRLKTELKA